MDLHIKLRQPMVANLTQHTKPLLASVGHVSLIIQLDNASICQMDGQDLCT